MKAACLTPSRSRWASVCRSMSRRASRPQRLRTRSRASSTSIAVIATDPEGETLRFFTTPIVALRVRRSTFQRTLYLDTVADRRGGSTVSCVIGVVDPSDNADLQQITIQVGGEVENRDPVIASQPATTATQASPTSTTSSPWTPTAMS